MSETAEAPKAVIPKGPLMIGLGNTIALLILLGTTIYTKTMYERHEYTELEQRQQLDNLIKIPIANSTPALITLEPFTANISPTPAYPEAAEGTESQINGRLHYVSATITLEIYDSSRKAKIEEMRAVFNDHILSVLGKKSFHQLVTVQGRHLLRMELIEQLNALLGEPLIQDVFFSDFVVQ